jgi:hypothetical protein
VCTSSAALSIRMGDLISMPQPSHNAHLGDGPPPLTL